MQVVYDAAKGEKQPIKTGPSKKKRKKQDDTDDKPPSDADVGDEHVDECSDECNE